MRPFSGAPKARNRKLAVDVPPTAFAASVRARDREGSKLAGLVTVGELGADTAGEDAAWAVLQLLFGAVCCVDRGVVRGSAGSFTMELSVGSLGGVTGSDAASLAQLSACRPPPPAVEN